MFKCDPNGEGDRRARLVTVKNLLNKGSSEGIGRMMCRTLDHPDLRAMAFVKFAENIVCDGLLFTHVDRAGPKKPVPKRTRFKDEPHGSTKKLLDLTLA